MNNRRVEVLESCNSYLYLAVIENHKLRLLVKTTGNYSRMVGTLESVFQGSTEVGLKCPHAEYEDPQLRRVATYDGMSMQFDVTKMGTASRTWAGLETVGV